MTSRRRGMGAALVAIVVAAFAAGARGDDAGAPTGDLKAIQGNWTAVGDVEMTCLFDGDKLRANVNGQDYVARIVLDPKATPHPTIDFTIVEGPENAGGKAIEGIYKLEGDRLTFCVNRPDKGGRPSEFKAVEDESYLFTLKRAK